VSTVTDYADRTVDVSAFHGVAASGEIRLDQSLFTDISSGLVITGIQKLAQRFLLELLTRTNSLRYLPARGTSFMTAARTGLIRTEFDAFTYFAVALGTVETNLRAEEAETDPADERFDSAELAQIAFLPGHLKLYISLLSAAGTERKIILPISTTP
jgi:hypothetical protein